MQGRVSSKLDRVRAGGGVVGLSNRGVLAGVRVVSADVRAADSEATRGEQIVWDEQRVRIGHSGDLQRTFEDQKTAVGYEPPLPVLHNCLLVRHHRQPVRRAAPRFSLQNW